MDRHDTGLDRRQRDADEEWSDLDARIASLEADVAELARAVDLERIVAGIVAAADPADAAVVSRAACRWVATFKSRVRPA